MSEQKLSSQHSVSFAADTEQTSTASKSALESRREKLANVGGGGGGQIGQRRVLSFSMDQTGEGGSTGTPSSPSSIATQQRASSIASVQRQESQEFSERELSPAKGHHRDSAIGCGGGDVFETNGADGHHREELDSGIETVQTTTPKRGRAGRGPMSASVRGSPSRKAMMVESIRRFSVNPATFMAERRKSRSHSLASFKLSYYPQDNRKIFQGKRR